MNEPVVFLDTETTGLHAEREAWEIAMIRRETPDSLDVRHHLFVDVDLNAAQPQALEIGRFTERYPFDEAVPAAEAAAEVARITHGAVIVGSNPHFDVATLERLLHRYGWMPTWYYRPVCVATMAAGRLAGTVLAYANAVTGLDTGRFRSYAVSCALGIDPPDDEVAHTAMGDAEWAMRLFDRMITGERP